jgi:hypothetical protein
MGTVQRVSLSLPMEAAERFKTLSILEKRILVELLTNLLKGEKLDSNLVRHFVSYRAQKKGLTPEILEQILQEENP